MDKVYIVLVNYINWKDSVECLESIFKQTYQNFQVILVDNSPTDDTIFHLENWLTGENKKLKSDFEYLVFPITEKPVSYKLLFEEEGLEGQHNEKVLLIKAKENKGFAAGNNIALNYIQKTETNKNAKIWLLNTDTVIPKDCIEKQVSFFQKNPKTGILGIPLMEYDQPETIQALGGTYNFNTGKISLIGANHPKETITNISTTEIQYPIGASMFLSLDYLEKVGLMEEKYFLYFEEFDWVLRGEEKGFQTQLSKDTFIYHKGGGSSGGGASKLAEFYGIRSKILFTKKFKKSTLPFLYLSFGGFIINRIRRNQFNRIPMLFKLISNPNLHYKDIFN
ncbi:glycosyltransferase family 2 protein [Aureivirga sp. CE67]|uniref:glycosyltransferase family 2 protein n=1 Tax=Aureivirga sp. CE67 TaxID=1788983 RepID=UPI0018CB2C71|nr:glycosyltransferase family 2 protein [Aureivirga sp. CE67]